MPADDSWGRLSDFAFDIGEHQRASEAVVRAATELAHELGARTTRSSVHLHYTFDYHDKASGVVSYLAGLGIDPTLGPLPLRLRGRQHERCTLLRGVSTRPLAFGMWPVRSRCRRGSSPAQRGVKASCELRSSAPPSAELTPDAIFFGQLGRPTWTPSAFFNPATLPPLPMSTYARPRHGRR